METRRGAISPLFSAFSISSKRAAQTSRSLCTCGSVPHTYRLIKRERSMGVREAQTLELAHIPRLLRDREPPSTASTAPLSSSFARSTSGDADSPTVAENAELTMAASMEAHWAKRKSQFFTHFKTLSDGDKGDGPNKELVDDLAAATAAAAQADSKCHVCNAALRLLRLRVSELLGCYHSYTACWWRRLTKNVVLSMKNDLYCSTTAATAGFLCAACIARTKCRCRTSAS